MGENNNPNPGDPNQDPNKGNPPAKGDNGGQNNPTEVDFSKLDETQLAKVLEDQRFWNIPRMKELRDGAKKAKELEEARTKEEQEQLKKKGEFEKLAQQREDESKSWKGKYEQSIINNKILQEASKAGITRLDLVDKLIDKSKIALDNDGNVTGATEAISQLIKDNDFLKGTGKSSLGGNSNPGGGNAQEFTLSQIQDPAFYQKNRMEIMKAQANGKIIDDRA